MKSQELFNRAFLAKDQAKFNQVRSEAFVRLLDGMGEALLNFKNTLSFIRNHDEPDWDKVARNLRESVWYHQLGEQAKEICREIQTGVK